MAEHIKLGSNPSSQYLLHLVCCYILYNLVHNTHTNIIHRWMDYTELAASHYSSSQEIIHDCQHRAVILLHQQVCKVFAHCNELLHLLLCMSLQRTLCDRGQQEDLSIPVQFRTITHCLRAFNREVSTSSNNNNSNKNE